MAKFHINIGKWYEYQADESLEQPDDDRQPIGWALVTNTTSTFNAVLACTSGSCPSGYYFTFDAGATGTGIWYYAHNSGTAPFHISVDADKGYTVEARTKFNYKGASGGHGQRIHVYDNNHEWEFNFAATEYRFLAGNTMTKTFTTNDDYHTYRISIKGDTAKIYTDGLFSTSVVMTSTTVAPGNYGILFGDDYFISQVGGANRWNYIKYRLDGAYAPNGKVDDGWAYEKIDITDNRRMQEFNIIRSQNTDIPEGKMKPAKIKVSGTIVGSDWSSFRDTVRRFKRMLAGGTQKIYIDEERFIEGLHRNFALRPQTQDFAKYSASFTCRYPFWLQNWSSYFSTAPVSAATFYITNNGDVEVPCKMIVTGAASGTIDDDILIDNVTATQQGKLVAVLQQTSELVIDKGYDQYNDYAVNVGTAASFGSYEGDLFTLLPGENAFVFVGGAVGTIEVYWREGFVL